MYAIAVSLTILGVMVVLLLAVEVASFRSRRVLISRRRLALRVAVGVLLLALLIAVFLGLFVLRLRSAQAQPQLFFVWWSSCLLVAVALVWAMLADLKDVENRFSERQHEIWKEMARFVADELAEAKKAGPGAGDDRKR